MIVILDSFRQAQSKSNIWLIPVFEGQVPEASKSYGFDLRQARAWGFKGRTGQSLHIALSRTNHHALLVGAGKTKEFDTEQARKTIGRALKNGSLREVNTSTVVSPPPACPTGRSTPKL